MSHSHFRRLASVLAALAVVTAAIVGATVALARAYPARGQWARPRRPIPFRPRAHAAAGGVASWLVVLILAGDCRGPPLRRARRPKAAVVRS